jgi:hypothetical protein
MTAPPRQGRTFGRTELAVFFLCLAAGALIVRSTVWESPSFGAEAIHRAGVGEDLLHGLRRGRQGFVGSLRHAPLPTLLALPLLELPAVGGPWALTTLALLSAAATGAALSAWLRLCGISRLTRLAAALAVTCSPLMMREVLRGSSEPLFALLLFSALCLLLHWSRTDRLRSLGYLAVVTGLALATRYQAVALLGVVAAVVALHLVQRRRTASYAEATLIILLTPSLYVTGLWIMSNWLLMGEACFFLRGLSNTTDRPGFLLHLLGEGALWRLPVLLGGVAVVGRLAARLTRPRWRSLAGLATLLVGLVFWTNADAPWRYRPARAEAALPRIVREFNTAYDDAWLVVAGYRGYDVAHAARAQPARFLYHTLSFYPEQMLRRTKGKRCYLLVPRPKGCDRWEDILLKYPDVYAKGAPFLVYERAWPGWRLWRMVRMDETDRR